VYGLLLTVSSPWLVWRYFVQRKNRRGWQAKLFGLVPTIGPPTNDVSKSSHINAAPNDSADSTRCIWLHAVSVGEVNLLEPIVKRLQRRFPNSTLAISTTTETGFDLASKKFGDQTVFFFPSDFSWAVNRALDRIRPDLIVLAELEVWPNFLQIAKRRKIPVAIVNGRLSESSASGYGRLRWLLGSTFGGLDLVAVQDERYADRFVEVGCAADKVLVTGNVKYDGALTDKNHPSFQSTHRLAQRMGLLPDRHQILVAGSTQLEDELAAIQAFVSLRERWEELRLVIVPRHPDRVGEIVSTLEPLGLTAIFRSSYSEDPNRPATLNSSSVLIVDVIGELSAWWSLADVAFVGGSMGSRGGQNMIEPAALGVPVCFGPNTKNFRTVVEQLLAAGGARVVKNEIELSTLIERLLKDSESARQLSLGAQKVISKNAGAADRTVELLASILKNPSHSIAETFPQRGVKKPAA
jgi:3-deoxy-D-manno-octulosonic-acid transferase